MRVAYPKPAARYANASIVIMHPARSSSSNRTGIAVISLDLSATLTCPKTRRYSLAHALTKLVKAFRLRTGGEKTSGLRSCLMIAKVCAEHNILVSPENSDFREICADVLFNRTKWSASEATTIFLELLNHIRVPHILHLRI